MRDPLMQCRLFQLILLSLMGEISGGWKKDTPARVCRAHGARDLVVSDCIVPVGAWASKLDYIRERKFALSWPSEGLVGAGKGFGKLEIPCTSWFPFWSPIVVS